MRAIARIHNLHYYLTLMAELRAAIESGTLGDYVLRFEAERRGDALRC